MDERTQYMIHACKSREWYVRDYLIPDMLEQGIREDDIEVWLDTKGVGNLRSCIESFAECGKRRGDRWHLQDDIVISRDFAEKTAKYRTGIVAGYLHNAWQILEPRSGVVPAIFVWNSFPCIHLPDDYCKEFVEWFLNDAQFRDQYRERVMGGKHDDSFWWDWFIECHDDEMVTNLSPNIVDHIDFLIGGSVINKTRFNGAATRSDDWDDEVAFDRMRDKLAHR